MTDAEVERLIFCNLRAKDKSLLRGQIQVLKLLLKWLAFAQVFVLLSVIINLAG